MEKKLKFNRDCNLEGKLAFEAGKTYVIDDTLGSASRWLTRGFAEEVSEQVEEVAKEEVLVEVPVEVEVVDAGLDLLDASEQVEEVAKEDAVVENKKGNKSKKGN